MTGWDVLSSLINGLPSIIATLMLVATGVIFLIGFSHHGYNFLKYGFKQTEISDLGAKIDGLHTEFKTDLDTKIDGLRTEIDGLRTEFKTELSTKIDQLRTEFKTELDTKIDGLSTEIDGLRTGFKTEMGGFRTELETIKVNHFGHLKNFLTELTSILVDKGVINNENKARLDNQLRGM